MDFRFFSTIIYALKSVSAVLPLTWSFQFQQQTYRQDRMDPCFTNTDTEAPPVQSLSRSRSQQGAQCARHVPTISPCPPQAMWFGSLPFTSCNFLILPILSFQKPPTWETTVIEGTRLAQRARRAGHVPRKTEGWVNLLLGGPTQRFRRRMQTGIPRMQIFELAWVGEWQTNVDRLQEATRWLHSRRPKWRPQESLLRPHLRGWGGWLPSNPRRELGFTFTIPTGHGFEVLLQPWQSQAPDTTPNTFPAPSAASGT